MHKGLPEMVSSYLESAQKTKRTKTTARRLRLKQRTVVLTSAHESGVASCHGIACFTSNGNEAYWVFY